MAKSARSNGASQTPSNTSQPVPALVRDRPPRKAKQAALDQKIWTSDLPATRKRALSRATDTAAQLGKQKKIKGGSVIASMDKQPPDNPKDGMVQAVPPRFARKAEVLLAADLENSEEDDVPLRVLASSRSAPPAPARVTSSTEKSTHVEDFQDPNDDGENSEDNLSDGDVDPEAHEQAVAEQSESDDEFLTLMEARGNTQALGARLAAEQPKWSKTEEKKKAKGKRVSSEDDASDSEPARVVRLQEKSKGNRASERKAAGSSKTELRAQQEQPVFKTPAQSTGISHSSASTTAGNPPLFPSGPPLPMPTTTTGADDDSSDSDSDVEMVYGMAPHDYQIVFPARGGPLSLRAQHPDIQEAIHATIVRLERKIVVEDALPDARRRGRGVRQTMVDMTRTLVPKEKFRALLTRFITDGHFLKALASIPNQRISTFRGKLKDKSNSSVPSFFNLVPKKAQDRVEWLLAHLTYIYPCDFEKRQVSDDRPYRAPIVMHILRESFFKGSQSFYSRHEDVFTSSLPGRTEREVPLVMLALVGTAIHASLTDWKSGNCVEPSHFFADRYLDAYDEHKILLEEIRRSAPLKYHTMMYKLFDEASGAAPAILAAPVGTPSAISHLNLDAMEED